MNVPLYLQEEEDERRRISDECAAFARQFPSWPKWKQMYAAGFYREHKFDSEEG